MTIYIRKMWFIEVQYYPQGPGSVFMADIASSL